MVEYKFDIMGTTEAKISKNSAFTFHMNTNGFQAFIYVADKH